MGESTVFSILVNFEIPDYCSEQHNRGFNKEIALFLYPRAVQVEHYRIGRFIGVGNIRHEIGVYRIATVRVFGIIKIYHIERGRIITVTLLMCQHVIVGNHRQIRKFVVIQI